MPVNFGAEVQSLVAQQIEAVLADLVSRLDDFIDLRRKTGPQKHKAPRKVVSGEKKPSTESGPILRKFFVSILSTKVSDFAPSQVVAPRKGKRVDSFLNFLA